MAAALKVREGDDFVVLEIPDNRMAADLFGEHDRHLIEIEARLGVEINTKGNRLGIKGSSSARESACRVIDDLLQRLTQDQIVGMGEVAGAISMAERPWESAIESGNQGPELDTANDDAPATKLASISDKSLQIPTKRGVISARTPGQAAYIRALHDHELVFGIGPAGTGKTYVAVAMAVKLMMEGKVDRLLLSRPAVEAGERLGFLPGDMRDKVDPYLRPLYDALYDMMPGDLVMKRLETGEIEVAPLAFMRGRTLSNAFVILDEAQNCTVGQMKMFLTRLGENSRMVITGDPSQIDLPMGSQSGLMNAVDVLQGVKGVAMVRFTSADVVRHPLVTRIVNAYQDRENSLMKSKKNV